MTNILHPIMLTVRVVPYDPTWAETFHTIKSDLEKILAKVPLITIEHVGSTSIPGLAAKPLIDIDIVVAPENIFQAFAALSLNGYTYNPEGWLPDRASFRWNGHIHDQGASKPTEDGEPRRQVYLVIPSSDQRTRHMILKRVLLQDEVLRKEYGDVKLELAKTGYADIGKYGAAKDGIIQKIYARGEALGEKGEV
jgi:GrpB-like predicted nucleotidyltransferase (UPF0157 family)